MPKYLLLVVAAAITLSGCSTTASVNAPKIVPSPDQQHIIQVCMTAGPDKGKIVNVDAREDDGDRPYSIDLTPCSKRASATGPAQACVISGTDAGHVRDVTAGELKAHPERYSPDLSPGGPCDPSTVLTVCMSSIGQWVDAHQRNVLNSGTLIDPAVDKAADERCGPRPSPFYHR